MSVDLKAGWYITRLDGSIWKPTKPFEDINELSFPADFERVGDVPVTHSKDSAMQGKRR